LTNDFKECSSILKTTSMTFNLFLSSLQQKT